MKIKCGNKSLKHVITECVLDPFAANRLHHMLQDRVLGFIILDYVPFWPESKGMTPKNHQVT